MSNDIPHPDRLAPGDFVGPWKILEVLGAGGMGRVFKAESEGKIYALKMAVRLPGEKVPGEEDVDGRTMREAMAMLGRTPHPNVPRVFYGALADGYPFKPDLPLEKLAAVIQLRMPRAPYRINPKVPKSLSTIAMRLLAKRPEDRFESAEALHRALWEANKERTSREWKVPLDLPESGPAPMTEEEMQERKLDEERAERAARAREQEEDTALPKQDAAAAPAEEARTEFMNSGEPRHTKSVRRPLLRVAMACALVVGLVALAWWWRYSPPDTARANVARPTPTMNSGSGEKVAPPWKWPDSEGAAAFLPTTTAIPTMISEDSVSVKTLTTQPSTARRAARKTLGTAVICSALTGCPGAQVRPAPPAEACPEGAWETMAKWNIKPGDNHVASFDPMKGARYITVSEGRTTVYITGGDLKGLRGGNPMSGRLIFGDRIYGRLTEVTVNGSTFPVCFELEDHTEGGRGLVREPNGSADTAKTFSTVTVKAVSKFE